MRSHPGAVSHVRTKEDSDRTPSGQELRKGYSNYLSGAPAPFPMKDETGLSPSERKERENEDVDRRGQ